MTKLLILLLLPITCLSQSWTYQKQYSRWAKAAKQNLTGGGVRIAVVDLGCNTIGTPEDEIWVNPTGGYDFIDDDADYSESTNHGTPVVSQIAGSSIALAPDAEIYVLRVFNPGTTEAAFMNALQWIVDNNIDVVNMSFAYNTDRVDSFIMALVSDHDIVVFAASGNSFTDAQTERPATLTGVYAVNAYPENGEPYQKNIIPQDGGHGINLASAGRVTEGIYNSGTYGSCNGTSFACSFSTGMFALYLQKARRTGRTITRARVAEYMIKKCVKQSFSNYFGAGFPTL